jgi:hypothetical protein
MIEDSFTHLLLNFYKGLAFEIGLTLPWHSRNFLIIDSFLGYLKKAFKEP